MDVVGRYLIVLVLVCAFALGFTLNGTVKILDYGLARLLENADAKSNEVYAMSGETGSLRYMAPGELFGLNMANHTTQFCVMLNPRISFKNTEVADALPYNHKADVYSFGVILWELNTTKKPFEGLNREMFYERVVHGEERPPMNKKWPQELCDLIAECWSADLERRPSFGEVVERIDGLLAKEKEGGTNKKSNTFRRISGMIDRHSTWF